jgi:hypothetical protein
VLYSVPLALGLTEEKQVITVPLIEELVSLEVTLSNSVKDTDFQYAVLKVSRTDVQIYSATFNMHVKLTGLRYFVYYWFFTSAVFGILYIMFFEFWFILICWLAIRNYQSNVEEEERRKKLSQFGPSSSFVSDLKPKEEIEEEAEEIDEIEKAKKKSLRIEGTGVVDTDSEEELLKPTT